jgi:hypothetical protein
VWVPTRHHAVVLLDYRGEEIAGFAIQHNGRFGFWLDIDFVKLRLSLADERCQEFGW